MVAGGNYPLEAQVVRKIVGPMIPILIPGVGAQGGAADVVVPLGLRFGENGFVNSSRGTTFAPLEGQTQPEAIKREIKKLHDEIVKAQNAA